MVLKEREIFHQALTLQGTRREAFLKELAVRDEQLHAKVLKLLRASEESEFLERSPLRASPRGGHGGTIDTLAEGPSREDEGALAGVILGDYQLDKQIAVGGVGVVYRARQVSLNRSVAIKILRSSQLAAPAQIQRFRAEAEAVASLDHPHIIPVYEVGEAGGYYFFSMKLIEGPSLAEVLEDYSSPDRAVELIAKIARAVHHAHQRGVLHRDLKPSNILLDAGTIPYVADFGIAKRLDVSQEETADGLICGTPSYMAPEQVSPRVGRITARTDVYSLGCMLYELLAGRRPLGGDSISETFHAILETQPRPPGAFRPGVPRDLETICMKCLNKQPWLRYDSAAELADDLERWLAHIPIQARKAGPLERMVLLWHRKPVVTTLGVVVFFLVVIIAFGASFASLQLQRHLDRAIEAESAATERLRNSLIAQASANRRTGVAGRQRQSLELLTQAAAIARGPELRNEALAALALIDLDVEADWPLPKEPFTIFAFSEAGSHYARGFYDGRLEVLRLDSRVRPERVLPGNGDPVWLARFSPDGQMLLARYQKKAASSGPALALWDLSSGDLLWKSDIELGGAAAEFHPRLPQILLGTLDGKLVIVDYRLGREVDTLTLRGQAVNIDIQSAGRLAAVGTTEPGRIMVFDLADRSLLWEFGTEVPVGDVAWSHDGELLTGVFHNRLGIVWDFPSRRQLATLRGHQAEIVYAQFLPTAPILMTYSWDETTRLWDANSGEELLVANRRGYRFSRDGRKLFFLTTETAGYWGVHHGEILRKLYGHVEKNPRLVFLGPDGVLAASVGSDETILWDTRSLSRVGRLPAHPRFQGFSADGNSYFTCGQEGLGRHAFEIAAGRFIGGRTTRLSSAPCDYVAIDPSEKVAAAFLAGSENLQVIHLESGEMARLELDWPREDVRVSPDGRLAASGTWRGRGVRVWDLIEEKVLIDLIPESIAARVAFSPDGQWLAAGTNRECRLWSTRDWTLKATYERPLDYSNLPGRVDFSFDGRFMAVAKTDRLITLLTVPDLEPIADLESPGYQEFEDLRFSPDGGRLFVASSSNHVQIWDLAAAQERLRELQLEDSGMILPFVSSPR